MQPDNPAFHFNRGNALKSLQEWLAAVKSYERAIAVRPNYADAYCNRGIALHAWSQFDAALVSYEHALAIDPLDADTHFNRGLTLHALGRLDTAIRSFDRAIQLRPGFPEVYRSRGDVLRDAKQWSAAVSSYDVAIKLRPDYVDAYWNRRLALLELKKFGAAIADWEMVIKLRPQQNFMFGDLLHAKTFLCDWTDFGSLHAHVKSMIEDGVIVSSPFAATGTFDSPAIQQAVAESWAGSHHPPGSALGMPERRSGSSKIRLGYYSEDFHNHAACQLMAGLFELHDRSRFDLVAFSYGPQVNDKMRQRVMKCFDDFIDVRSMSDLDVTKRSRDLGIDIAIDLKGYAPGGRVGIFSERCAPVQVNSFGFPGTMGSKLIDYIIADQILIPEKHQKYYTEKIVHLPDTYQPNDIQRPLKGEVPAKEALGLPADAFIFFCLNDCYKISPPVFDRWMRILKTVRVHGVPNAANLVGPRQRQAQRAHARRPAASNPLGAAARRATGPLQPHGQHLRQHPQAVAGAVDLYDQRQIVPTNNAAEQALRSIVLKRKISGPTRALRGDQFLARGFSVHETCLRQGVDLWKFMYEAVFAAIANTTAPSLIPRPHGRTDRVAGDAAESTVGARSRQPSDAHIFVPPEHVPLRRPAASAGAHRGHGTERDLRRLARRVTSLASGRGDRPGPAGAQCLGGGGLMPGRDQSKRKWALSFRPRRCAAAPLRAAPSGCARDWH